jgi:hypothetical protein
MVSASDEVDKYELGDKTSLLGQLGTQQGLTLCRSCH